MTQDKQRTIITRTERKDNAKQIGLISKNAGKFQVYDVWFIPYR